MDLNVSYNGSQVSVLRMKSGLYRKTLSIPAETTRCKVSFSVPLRDIQQLWRPEREGLSRYLPWDFELRSAFHANAPVLSFSNRANENRMTIGIDDLVDDTVFHGVINQEKCTYDITIEIALPRAPQKITLTLDSRPAITWQEAVASWRESLRLPMPDFPASAWNPVYCSWYAIHAAVARQWVEKIGPLAKKLGFSTLILDDGWCYDDVKRVSPETIECWYQDVGDWEIAEKKFPNFPEHVKSMQKLGMDYLVWVAPTLIGDRSRLLAEHPECRDENSHECSHCRVVKLDDQKTVELLAKKCKSLVAKNHLDGLKVDFIDQLPVSLDEPNGRRMQNFVSAISRGIRAGAKDALIEFRQYYASPGTLPYATQFRACDAPFDYVLNLERCLQIRLLMGDGIPVHADPAYWGANETPENISRHMIAMMAGVPMLSMDLEKLSKSEEAIITHWMEFYKAHQDTLNLGKWTIHCENGAIDYAMAVRGEERIALAMTASCISSFPKGTMVLNASADEIPAKVSKSWKLDGSRASNRSIPVAGRGIL